MYDEIEFEIQDETSLEFDLEKEAYLVEPKTEKLEVIPNKEQQEFKPVQGTYYNDVVVEKIPEEYVIPKLSKKTITKNGTYKASDDDLDGYNQVNVETSGVDINDYFNTTYTGNVSSDWVSKKYIVKIPDIIIGNNITSLNQFCANYIYAPKIICNSNIKDMLRMYYYNKSSNIDTSGLNTSEVTNMARMFESCSGLTSLDVSNFNTSKVTNMTFMFSSCSSLKELDLSSFDTSKVTDMSYMFYSCNKLTNLDIRNFNFTNVTSYNRMFGSIPANCLIIVKNDTAKEWITSKFTTLTNVKTVAELEKV